MIRPIVFLLVMSVCLGGVPSAQAQQSLGQSDWQVPGQPENQWQSQAQPQQQQQQPGQSEWQVPGGQNQSQNQWQQPQQQQQPQQLGQSEWQTPQNGQNQSQNQWQAGNQYGQQNPSTFYGQASATQAVPQNGNGQYQEPGAYLNQQYPANQQGNMANAPPSETKHKKHKDKDRDKDSNTGDTIKAAASTLGRAAAVSASIAAPVMSSYFIGKGLANSRSYYSPMMMNPYMNNQMMMRQMMMNNMMNGGGYMGGSPYGGGGYGYGNGLSSFMHF